MTPAAVDWPELERTVAKLPHRAAVGVAVRAARRAAPAILVAEADFGDVALEWFNAAVSTIRVVESFVQGGPVSNFTLTIAAELPRLAASSMAAAMRGRGPSPQVERTETALAAASFAADAARASQRERVDSLVMLSLRNAEATEPAIGRLAEFDVKTLSTMNLVESATVDASENGLLGELWPFGEPANWSLAWTKLGHANLPVLLDRAPRTDSAI